MCPEFSVECHSDNLPSYKPDQLAEFNAYIRGADAEAKIVYRWSVSNGTIQKGQGTPRIAVSGFGDYISVTVEIDGFPKGCPNTSSCTQVWCPPPISRFYDKYGDMAFKHEKPLLDKFTLELEDNPGSQGFLVAYGQKLDSRRVTEVRLERAKAYLINEGKIEDGRVVTIYGGYPVKREIDLWIVPTGATPPSPSPTIEQ
jgi:hypothetical protein